MRRYIFMMTLLATATMQAQVINVNNNDGTYLPLETKDTREITFNEDTRIVTFTMADGERHSFHTGKVESISPRTDKIDELSYSLNHSIAFDQNDKNNINEVVETIIYDEAIDESGDFIENLSVSYEIRIEYTENDVTVSGSTNVVSFEKNGAHLTITGTKGKTEYIVSGKSDNGSLKIYSPKKFQLYLNGLELTNPNGPAINIQTGKTIYFTLADGTTNRLCDGVTYSAPTVVDGVEEDQKGTLFSEGQLIFNGTGTLEVTSLGGHGICSDDYIRIRSGNINIKSAAKDGFHTNDKFIISRTETSSPVIRVNATTDGIDCGKGEVIIDAGDIELNSGGEAIKVVYESATPDPLIIPNATINGGYIKFATTGEKSSGIKTTGEYKQTGGIIHGTVKGNGSKILNSDKGITITGGKITGFAEGTVLDNTTLAGGLKCEGDFKISNGTVAIECSGKGNKGINCNYATITGGDVTILAENTANGESESIALDANSVVMTNGKIILSSYNNAISANSIVQAGGKLQAQSQNSTALSVDAKQTNGWLLIKEAE